MGLDKNTKNDYDVHTVLLAAHHSRQYNNTNTYDHNFFQHNRNKISVKITLTVISQLYTISVLCGVQWLVLHRAHIAYYNFQTSQFIHSYQASF